MPMHDWTRVEAGIFHAFHHDWITELHRVLNKRLLPPDYYALPEQQAGKLGPDVLALHRKSRDGPYSSGSSGRSVVLAERPVTRFTAHSDTEAYRRKKSSVVIRHVTGDKVVAVIEVVSPGNKNTKNGLAAFRHKVAELLEARIHLLLLDPIPPGARDPSGIHAVIWDDVTGDPFTPPADKPLTLVSYECDTATRAYIEPVAVGDPLPDMPLFLEPNGCVMVPLEATYRTAFEGMPSRWADILEGKSD